MTHVAQFVFDTYVNGDADGPVGITRLAHILNERGERIGGKRFHTSNVHGILTNTAYIGFVMYNRRCSRTGEARPEDEWVPIPVPALMSEDLFYAARAQMAARDPKMGAAAEKTNTNLLTGIANCGCGGDGCGSAMTTSTGKSGLYRYYACQRRANAGASECAGRRMPMDALDAIVVDAVAAHVLERISKKLRDPTQAASREYLRCSSIAWKLAAKKSAPAAPSEPYLKPLWA